MNFSLQDGNGSFLKEESSAGFHETTAGRCDAEVCSFETTILYDGKLEESSTYRRTEAGIDMTRAFARFAKDGTTIVSGTETCSLTRLNE